MGRCMNLQVSLKRSGERGGRKEGKLMGFSKEEEGRRQQPEGEQ